MEIKFLNNIYILFQVFTCTKYNKWEDGKKFYVNFTKSY